MAWRSLTLMAAALAVPAPACAQNGYAFYEGDLHFERGTDPVCTALTNGTYKVYFAAHTSPRGVEAYMYGERIMHAYISGSDAGHLQAMFLGESVPSHPMRLQAVDGGFLGLVQSKTLVSELYGACTASNSEFKVARTARDAQSAFQDYAEQFQLDVSSQLDLNLAQRGHIKEALPRLQRAFAQKLQKYAADHPQMLRYYYYLARAYEEAGQYPYAAYWYQKAVDVCTHAFGPESACAPITQLKLGQSLTFNGNTRDAESHIRNALLVADKVFGPRAPVSWPGFNALALVMISTGRYAEAESVLKQAIALGKQGAGAELNVAAIQVSCAALYRQTGQFKLAEQTLRDAIATDQRVEGADSAASIFPKVLLSQIMNLAGQSAAAEPVARGALDQAMKIAGPERPDHPLLSIARVALANIDLELAKFPDAERLLRQALDNDKKYLGPDHASVAVEEISLAKLLRSTGREQEALPLLKDAYRISHLTDIQGVRWRVPGELMQLYASPGVSDPALAVFYGKQAVNELLSMRSNLSHSSSGTLQSFVSTAEVKSIYTTLAQLLLGDGRIPEAQQVLALLSEQEMDQFSERSMLADAAPNPHSAPVASARPPPQTVAEVILSKSEGVLAELIVKQIEVGQEYDRLKQLQQAQGDDFGAADRAKLDQLQAQMEDYQAKFLAAQSRIAKSAHDPAARQARAQEISSYSTGFQGTLKNLGHDAVIAQYFITPEAVEIILTTPNSVVNARSIIKAAKLNQLIRDFRVTLSNPAQNPVPLAQQLYAVLVSPIAGALEKSGAKTLMVLLHDTLRYVPFAALNNGKSYLVESMAVVNVNEAALDKLVTPPKADAWTVWGLGVTKAGKDYPALPYAGEELNNIKVALGGKSSVKLDKDFTEARLQQGLGGYYPVIHIASHFEFTPGSIDKSVLLLGDGSLLSLKQIETKLNFSGVELLTLSACETAVGDDTLAADGDEVAGLGATAQRKGAMAVIATLWPVADESTATLMNTLYRAHQVEHLDKAESLRHAQLTLLHGSAPGAGFSHPFYWAPFILMGNWL